MGFMDKAKKLAEQAQEKLDETQKNFNKSNAPEGQPQEGGVKYDEHGRPIQEAPPAGATAPPAAEPTPPAPDPTKPVEGATGGPPASEPPASEPAEPPAPAPPASKPAEGGDANASPDPFKPIQ
jgi:hypothetical protein